MAEPLTFGELLSQLAAPTPTPGGGSAAAAAGALAASLLEMAAGISAEKRTGVARRRLRAALQKARTIRKRCEAAVARDARAYGAVRAARRALRASPGSNHLRRRAVRAQLMAVEVPLDLGEDLVALLRASRTLRAVLHPPLLPDFTVAAALASAALTGAAANVAANLADLGPSREGGRLADRYERLRAAAGTLEVRLPAC